MASFTPPDPPFVPDDPTPPPTLNVPLPPPEVGEGSPWAPADSENRDRILDWWRMWFRRVFFPWIEAFTTYWDAQWNRLATYINTWITAADTYISEHAIAGYGFRPTATDIAGSGTTNVVFTNVDTEFRPVVVGDLALDESSDGNFGIVTVVIDATHATVQYLGSLRGAAGYSWRLTDTPIADSGTTNVILEADTVRPFNLGDLVLDTTSDGNFGVITTLIDPTHVTVTFAGSLRGPSGADGVNGLSWRYTDVTIAGSGTTDVVFSGSPTPPLQIGDLVTDTTGSGNVATITVIADATHATVTYLENLKGAPGADGIIASIVPGDGISVDNTDPANPIVSVASAATWYYTDPTVMNNAIGHGPKGGDIGVLVMNGAEQTNSVWIVLSDGSAWSGVSVNLHDEFDWTTWSGTLNLGVNTNLEIAGIVATEPKNGTHPTWNPRAGSSGLFAPARDSYRQGLVGPNTAPSGSLVQNDDNTWAITAATRVEIYSIAPTIDLDGTDEYELRLWGLMSENAIASFIFADHDHSPQDDPYCYAGFGKTLQLNAGTLTQDANFVNAFGNVSGPFWDLFTDSTGDPLYVEVTMRVVHSNSTNQKVAYCESLYYDAQTMVVMFRRTGTFYMYDGIDYDGFQVRFGAAFTGTLKVKAL